MGGSIRDYVAEHPATALLAVEVAVTSLDYDTTTKAKLYATAGIPEYWVLDLEGKRLIVFRGPAPLTANLADRLWNANHTCDGRHGHAASCRQCSKC